MFWSFFDFLFFNNAADHLPPPRLLTLFSWLRFITFAWQRNKNYYTIVANSHGRFLAGFQPGNPNWVYVLS
jgi:hypothetical protein